MNRKTSVKEKDIVLWVLWSAVVLILAATMVFPLLKIFTELKAESFATVFGSRKFISVMANSARSAFWGALLSVALGYAFAYAVAVAGIPFSQLKAKYNNNYQAMADEFCIRANEIGDLYRNKKQ